MNSFEFLRKMYISTESAVIITNSVNSIFWTKNIERLRLNEEDITGENVYKYFKVRVNKLYPSEGVASINGLEYHYNVKTVSEKGNHDFIIIEIITEPISHTYVNDDTISELTHSTQKALEKGTDEILSIVNRSANGIGKEERKCVEDSVKRILASNITMSSLAEMKEDLHSRRKEYNSLSNLLTKYAETCQAVFMNHDVEIDMTCVEDIYGNIGEDAFYDICTAILSRALCSCRGLVDKIDFRLEILITGTAELSVHITSPSGKVKMSNVDELKGILAKGNAIGTDLFNIRYFCGEINGGATEKIDRVKNETIVSIRIPKCRTQGVTLFTCNNSNNAKDVPTSIYDSYGKITQYAKVVVALSNVLSELD